MDLDVALSRHAISRVRVPADTEEPLEPQLRDLVVPASRGGHVDELAGFAEAQLAVLRRVPAEPAHGGALEQERNWAYRWPSPAAIASTYSSAM